MLAAAAEAHFAWLDEHADDVEAVPGDSAPHDGDPGDPDATSDYAEHHADRSAPADVDDLLSAQLVKLIPGHPGGKAAGKAGKKPKGGGTVDTEEADRIVDDAGDVILAEGWVPPVPNILATLEVAGSDRKLRKYWVRGEGAAKINWGHPGDFDTCVAHLGKYVEDPKGLCAEYHKAATGEWPGKKAHGGKG